MAQALYLREADGNRLILNQIGEYGEVQIVPLNQNRELVRGGTVISDKELSRLVREFLDSDREEHGSEEDKPVDERI